MVKVKLLTCATDRPDVTGGENCGRQASRREFPGNTGIFRTGTLEKPQPVDFPDLGPRRNHNRWIFRTGALENPQKVVFPTESIGETTKGGFSNPECRRIHNRWIFRVRGGFSETLRIFPGNERFISRKCGLYFPEI